MENEGLAEKDVSDALDAGNPVAGLGGVSGVVHPESLVSQAYRSVLNAICEGALAPGERLTQERLAEALNVSRQPVGQALGMLKAQGFVQEAGKRGLVVAPPDLQTAAWVYELRSALDALGARLATARLQPADVEVGRALIREGRAAVAEGVVQGLVQADASFHLFIYRLAGNPLLVEVMELYWNHLRRAMVEVLKERGQGQQVWDEHEAMFEAMLAGDEEAAQVLAREHVVQAARRLLSTRSPMGWTGNGHAGDLPPPGDLPEDTDAPGP